MLKHKSVLISVRLSLSSRVVHKHSSDSVLQENGCGALGTMAQQEYNKVTIAKLGGVETIIAAMRNHETDLGVQEHAGKALRYLTDNVDEKDFTCCYQALAKTIMTHPDQACVLEHSCEALHGLLKTVDDNLRVPLASYDRELVNALVIILQK